MGANYSSPHALLSVRLLGRFTLETKGGFSYRAESSVRLTELFWAILLARHSDSEEGVRDQVDGIFGFTDRMKATDAYNNALSTAKKRIRAQRERKSRIREEFPSTNQLFLKEHLIIDLDFILGAVESGDVDAVQSMIKDPEIWFRGLDVAIDRAGLLANRVRERLAELFGGFLWAPALPRSLQLEMAHAMRIAFGNLPAIQRVDERVGPSAELLEGADNLWLDHFGRCYGQRKYKTYLNDMAQILGPFRDTAVAKLIIANGQMLEGRFEEAAETLAFDWRTEPMSDRVRNAICQACARIHIRKADQFHGVEKERELELALATLALSPTPDHIVTRNTRANTLIRIGLCKRARSEREPLLTSGLNILDQLSSNLPEAAINFAYNRLHFHESGFMPLAEEELRGLLMQLRSLCEAQSEYRESFAILTWGLLVANENDRAKEVLHRVIDDDLSTLRVCEHRILIELIGSLMSDEPDRSTFRRMLATSLSSNWRMPVTSELEPVLRAIGPKNQFGRELARFCSTGKHLSEFTYRSHEADQFRALARTYDV